MTLNDMETGTANDALTSAVSNLFKQIVDLCILAGVSEREASDMLRAAYALSAPVKRLSGASMVSSESNIFAAGQVLGEWHQRTDFLDAAGNPRRLSLANDEFEQLCKSACAAADPQRVLDLLRHTGAVVIDHDYVRAVRRDVIIDYAHPAAVHRAIQLAAMFAATLHHNLARPQPSPGLFERTVVSTKLSRHHMPALLAYLGTHAQSLLEDLDEWISARQSSETGESVGIGVYLFRDLIAEGRTGHAESRGADLPGQ